MIPKRIVVENFLSYGSPPVEIVFSDDEPLWVIGGPNGVGKSAVFDALTYSLYAQHRGGARDHVPLIRHGTNGLRVTLEFEFNGVDYRITRNGPLQGRPTREVKRRHEGEWKSVELPPVVGSQDAVKLWSERTLGLGFDAFTSSVLLRQGEADKIITATGGERLKILKKIIAVERYESLSNKVHGAARKHKDRMDDLCVQRDGLTAVTVDEVAAAQTALATADLKRISAQDLVEVALQRLSTARQWTGFQAKQQTLSQYLKEAGTRAATSGEIRRQKARLDELASIVPTLRQLASARQKAGNSDRDLEEHKHSVHQISTELNAFRSEAERAHLNVRNHRGTAKEHEQAVLRLRREIVHETRFIEMADRVATLHLNLNDFPDDLDYRLAAAKEEARRTAEHAGRANEEHTQASTLAMQCRHRHNEFAVVSVGIPCSRCNQPVMAEFAERERARLAQEMLDMEQQHEEAAKTRQAANARSATAESVRKTLEKKVQVRDQQALTLRDTESLLSGAGITGNAEELRRQIKSKTEEADRHERLQKSEADQADTAEAEAEKFDGQCRIWEDQLKQAEKALQSAETAAAGLRGQSATLIAQLPAGWHDAAQSISEAAIEPLDQERRALAESGVADQCRRLDQDALLQEDWTRQLDDVNNKIAEIPEDARLPVADAEAAVTDARSRASAASRARDTAKDHADELVRQANAFGEIVKQITIAERRSAVHQKLDTLLGKDGLQRELVRSAERDIAHLANETVQSLSDGDLAIELHEDADGADEAFDLRIRRANDSSPIAVALLSGSQKFRVAVSVALAIGRFASGQARPLECVIIDEGFGSLDRDGLQAMAEELNRLRGILRRIVLVSHQEDFVDRFPVAIKLSPGPDGTIAESLRR